MIPFWSPPSLRAQSGFLPHAPIHIIGNSGFTAPNGVTFGSGTLSDPYVIQGWDINASTANGIKISNSNVYFTIRDVYVHSGVFIGHYGVILDHSVNGRIENSILTRNYEAISLNYSTHIDISSNHIFLNSIGADFGGGALTLAASNDTVIANNNITDNNRSNIVVNNSQNVNITGNTASISGGIASSGVSVYDSTNMMIVNNTMSYNENFGLLLAGSTGVHVYHNRFFGNSPNAQEIAGSGNSWDNGYPSGGNYWFDYGYYFQAEDNCSGPNQNVCTGPDGIGDIPYVLQTGQQDHFPLVFHDGAIVNIQAPSSIVRGKTASVEVTAENFGMVLEKRFIVTLSYGNTLIGSQTLADFPPYSPMTLNFAWTTGTLLENGVSPGNYTLTGSVSISLDTNSTNNSKSTFIQVLGFPATPLFYVGGNGQVLVITAAVVAAGLIISLTLLIVRRRNREARTQTASSL